MIATQTEMMAIKFADCMARLRNLGLTGEVVVTAGVVMVSTTSKISASGFRKAIKAACAKTGAVFTESRKGGYVFTVAI